MQFSIKCHPNDEIDQSSLALFNLPPCLITERQPSLALAIRTTLSPHPPPNSAQQLRTTKYLPDRRNTKHRRPMRPAMEHAYFKPPFRQYKTHRSRKSFQCRKRPKPFFDLLMRWTFLDQKVRHATPRHAIHTRLTLAYVFVPEEVGSRYFLFAKVASSK